MFGETVNTDGSSCCECGHTLDAAAGVAHGHKPSAGDFTLCGYCASLNVFADGTTLRKPTDDEIFEAAADSTIQRLRRIILRAQKQANEEGQTRQDPQDGAQRAS